MILVDVTVPALGRQYDFQLEETIPVKVLIQEMAEVFCQKEHCQAPDGELPLSLYSRGRQARLPPETTLLQDGVCSGDQLILL